MLKRDMAILSRPTCNYRQTPVSENIDVHAANFGEETIHHPSLLIRERFLDDACESHSVRYEEHSDCWITEHLQKASLPSDAKTGKDDSLIRLRSRIVKEIFVKWQTAKPWWQRGKKLEDVKPADRKVKIKEKIQVTVEKERFQLRLAGSGLKVPLCLVLFVALMVRPTCASVSCPENQIVELGDVGTIACSFPDNFHAVHWYNDIRPGSSPLISYTHHTEDKTEFCVENKTFDVAENGSLIICNVAVWHEKDYKVFLYTSSTFYLEFTISLKVIASPGNRAPVVDCDNCHEGRYYLVQTNGTLGCSFQVARPPVSIEWVQRYPQRDSITTEQEFRVTNNSKGTFNTSAYLHLFANTDNQITVFVCRATYRLQEWKREREILVEFSRSGSFSSVPSSTFYMETSKRAEIRCGESDHIIRIWKLILTTLEAEMIGFRFGNSTEMTKDISGIEISPEGNLMFSSPQIQHEGDYVCVYSNGVKDAIQKTTVVVLVAPSPPYIKITGCDDAEYNCVKDEEMTQEVTCTVNGVYPNATLEWVPKNPSQIYLYNYTTVNNKNGHVYDISASVGFLFTENVMCENEIYIECRLQGPTSRIIKAERVLQLAPKNCTVIRDDRDDGGKYKAWMIAVTIVMMLLLVIFLIRTTYSIFKRLLRGTEAESGIRSDEETEETAL